MIYYHINVKTMLYNKINMIIIITLIINLHNYRNRVHASIRSNNYNHHYPKILIRDG